LPTSNAVKFIESASAGIPFETLLGAARISPHTLKRRIRLRPDQSDRLVRIARILDFAEDSIGAQTPALEWLSTPSRALSGARPIEELDTDAGAKRVRHGDYILNGLGLSSATES
jgi:putative toxin-antitoxin system antitoxin component (TIGR02293 family)